MPDRLTLEIATPTRLVVATSVDEVVAPGSQGYFGVLPGHAPFLTTLGTGELTYRIGRDEHHLAVAGGFVEVRNDKVIVLADSAERPEEVDRGRAERARQRAERRLSGRPAGDEPEEIDYARAARSLARSTLERLEAAAQAGTLSRGGAEALADAFRYLTHLRLREQLRRLAAGGQPDNRVPFGGLSPLEQRRLRDALRTVVELQRATARSFHTGE